MKCRECNSFLNPAWKTCLVCGEPQEMDGGLISGIGPTETEIIEKRSIHLDEAVRLYRERGWIQIYSGYLKCNFYLIKDECVKVPNPSLPIYTEKEIGELTHLRINELKTLHEAKQIFGGGIITSLRPH